MPKKVENKKKKNINVRISELTYEKWEKYADKNGFASISSLVRYCTNEFVDGTHSRMPKTNNENHLRKRVNDVDKHIQELWKSQQEIMKIMAKKGSKEAIPEDSQVKEYQKRLILRLLSKQPRDENELSKLMELPETEVLSMLNEFMGINIIKMLKNGNFQVMS